MFLHGFPRFRRLSCVPIYALGRAYMIRCTDLFCQSCIYAAIPPVPAVLYMYAWYGVGIVSPDCVDPVTRPAPRGCLLQPSFPRSVTLRCSMLSALRGSNNRCPHCGGVERRSKNNEKPVCPVLLYHISIDFSSAERPHFSTVCGFSRKKV